MAVALAPVLVRAHDVGVSASPTRRRFTAAYKLKVIADAAACTAPGAVAALLRREGLYSSHLAAWRAAVLAAAYAATPKRFVRRPPPPICAPERRVDQPATPRHAVS